MPWPVETLGAFARFIGRPAINVTLDMPAMRLMQFWRGTFEPGTVSLGGYGVLAYAVGQRSMEIEMRMMLGASRRNVLTLVLSDGVRLPVYGMAAGGIVAAGG